MDREMLAVEPLTALPEWIGAALLSAAIAALGYVATLLIELGRSVGQASRTSRARLVQLLVLLRAGDVAFAIQSENRNSLDRLISERDPSLDGRVSGFDRRFAAAFPSFTQEARALSNRSGDHGPHHPPLE